VDERDKDLTGLFVRDLDEIALPPRGAWQRARGRETTAMRTSRYILTAGAIAAVLAIALIVGFQLRDRNATVANPSASPRPELTSLPIIVRPSPTANPNVTATPSAPGGAIYNDDFGFIVTAGDIVAANIRKESSNARIGGFASQGFAVSPDGRQVAYWRQSTGGSQLDIYTVSSGSARTILGLSTQGGGAIAWSSDGTGVVFAANSTNSSPSGGPTSQLITVDLASGDHVQIALRTDGRIFWPLAWNRGLNLVAGGVTGDGGFMSDYFTIDTAANASALTSLPVQGRMTIGSVHASTDAKFVVGTDIDTGFSYWPLADFSAKIAPAESKYGQAGALWRPGTHEIGFIGPSNQFWLCNVDRNTPLGCGTTAFSGVPDGAFVRTFRADGSAVVLAVQVGAGAGQTSYTLVQFTNDPFAAKATGGERVTFSDLGGLTTSVRFR
jgi:hypothetical protein